eukprot:m.95790 g.95790  ORF g.95790 m.95790 type:complete len:253 (-) comp8610_c0_seq2:297-1055(-)
MTVGRVVLTIARVLHLFVRVMVAFSFVSSTQGSSSFGRHESFDSNAGGSRDSPIPIAPTRTQPSISASEFAQLGERLMKRATSPSRQEVSWREVMYRRASQPYHEAVHERGLGVHYASDDARPADRSDGQDSLLAERRSDRMESLRTITSSSRDSFPSSSPIHTPGTPQLCRMPPPEPPRAADDTTDSYRKDLARVVKDHLRARVSDKDELRRCYSALYKARCALISLLCAPALNRCLARVIPVTLRYIQIK